MFHCEGFSVFGNIRPFNLHPILSFEKMGAFATLKKIGFLPELFQGVNLRKKLGFIR